MEQSKKGGENLESRWPEAAESGRAEKTAGATNLRVWLPRQKWKSTGAAFENRMSPIREGVPWDCGRGKKTGRQTQGFSPGECDSDWAEMPTIKAKKGVLGPAASRPPVRRESIYGGIKRKRGPLLEEAEGGGVYNTQKSTSNRSRP